MGILIKYTIVGGDQQTYSIMKNLEVKYSDHYEWMYPVPGKWHIMNTAAEVIKYVIYDGGLGSNNLHPNVDTKVK